MPFIDDPELIRGLGDKQRAEAFSAFESVGIVPPKKGGVIEEGLQGIASGALQVGKGFSSTLDELGISSPLESITDYERRNQQFRPSADYEAFSLDPANLARTITTGITQATTGIGAGIATSLVTGNPVAGGAVTFASTFGQTYGEEVKDFRRDMPEGEAQTLALVSTIGQSLLESVLGPERLVGGIGKSLMKGAVAKSAEKFGASRIKQVGLSMLKSGLEEGSEEVLQDILSNAVAAAGGREGDILPSIKELANTFTAGALPGLILGGGMKAVETRGQTTPTGETDTTIPTAATADEALRQTLQTDVAQDLPVIGEGIDPNAPVQEFESKEAMLAADKTSLEDIPKVDAEGKPLKIAKPQILTTGEDQARFTDRVAIIQGKNVTAQAVDFLQGVIDAENITSEEGFNDALLNQVAAELTDVVGDAKTEDRIWNKIGKKLKYKDGDVAEEVTEAVEPTVEAPKVELELEEDSELDVVTEEAKQSMGAILKDLPEGMQAKRTPDGWEVVPIEPSKTAQRLAGKTPRTEPLITPEFVEPAAPVAPIDPNLENVAIKSEGNLANQAVDFLNKYSEAENITDVADIPNEVLDSVFADLQKFIKEPDALEKVWNKVGRVMQRNLESKTAIKKPGESTLEEVIDKVPDTMTVEQTKEGFKITPKKRTASEQLLSGVRYQVTGVADAKADPNNRVENAKIALPYADVVQTSDTTATATLPNGEVITVQLVDNIQTPEGQQARGSFISGDNIIQLSSNSDQGTVDHEVFHAAKAISGLTESDQKTLDKAFNGDEEAEAEAYRKYQDAKRKPRGPISQVFDKIKAAMVRMAKAFGYNSKNVVFDKVASGEVFQEQNVPQVQTQEQFQVVNPQNSKSTERRQANPFVTPEARIANETIQDSTETDIQRDVDIEREAEKFIADRSVANVIKDIAEGGLAMTTNLNKVIMEKALDDPSIVNMYIENDQTALDAMAKWIEQRSEAGRVLRLKSSLTGDPVKDIQNNIKKMILAPSRLYRDAPKDKKKEAMKHEKELIAKSLKNVKNLTGVDALNLTEEQTKDSKLIAKVMREIMATKAPLGDKLYEFWINSILSGFTTHATNTVGNIILPAVELGPQRALEASLNLFRRDPKSATFGEMSREWKSMFKSIKPAWENAMLAWDMEMPTDGVSKLEKPGVAIGGTLGRIVRGFGTRVLLAADELAKTIIQAGESEAFAYRQAQEEGVKGFDNVNKRVAEILADPKSDVHEIAHNRSLEMLHQQETGAFVAMLGHLAKQPGFAGWVGKFLFPFRKTPANITKTALRKSPLGILKIANDFRLGKLKGDKGTRQVAEQVMAWGAVFTLSSLMGGSDGEDEIFITGTQGQFGSSKARWERQNLPPSSIKINGTWYDYSRIQPFGIMLGLSVDGVNAWNVAQNEKDLAKASKMIKSSLRENIVDQTFLSGLNDVVRAFEKDQGMEKYATNFIASWVPNVYRGSVTKVDDVVRERRNFAHGTEWLTEQFGTLLAQKAGFIKGVPKVDMWGRDMENRNGLQTGAPFLTALWRATSPIKSMPSEMGKADQLIMNWNLKNPNDEYWPSVPGYSFSKSGEPIYLSGDEYYSFAKRAGQLAKAKIDNMIRKRQLSIKNPTKKDILKMRSIFTESRRRARKSEGL